MTRNDIVVISTALVVSAIIVASAFIPERCDSPPPTIPISDTVDHWAIWTDALIEVESGGNDYAVGRTNDWGCLQITPVLVSEVNRIQSARKFTMNDTKDRAKSIEMYNIIQAYYNPKHDLHLALKIWNPMAPVSYHKKVEQEYIKLLNTKYGTTNTQIR